MNERKPIPINHHPQRNQCPPREVSGIIIFDKNGNSIGISVNDGSLDYASKDEIENTVIVIRPPKDKENKV